MDWFKILVAVCLVSVTVDFGLLSLAIRGYLRRR